MNAVEQQKAEEAARRRHEDVRDCIIEAIGEVHARRTLKVRTITPETKLDEHHIDQRDLDFIVNWTAMQLDLERGDALVSNDPIESVEQLTDAIEEMLYLNTGAAS